ncbi:MAG TPA: GntR family transcriptional regulator [Burkholderiales bacterium]|nr:GntR family transcriptional regulator [Burkholderiales bacterium]
METLAKWRTPPPVLSDAVYQDLLERILSGVYKPGEVLRQEELAARYLVSRVPVREAMSRLASDGVLVFRPRRGYAVKLLDAREIEEVFGLRMLIEEHAGRLAAQHRQPDDIRGVAEILDKMDALDRQSANGMREWLELNRKFHAELFAASRRAHVCRVAASLRDTVEPYIRLEATITGTFDQADAEHREIFEAFQRGDADAVGRLCRLHCEHTAGRLKQGLGQRDQPISRTPEGT